jgi:hypothetical protein
MQMSQNHKIYGTSITRLRPNDGGSASGDPTWSREPERVLAVRALCGADLPLCSTHHVPIFPRAAFVLPLSLVVPSLLPAAEE